MVASEQFHRVHCRGVQHQVWAPLTQKKDAKAEACGSFVRQEGPQRLIVS